MKSNSINKIVDFTTYGHTVLNKIDKSEKKIVAILNGLTLGGGTELALSADVLLAVPKTKISFPETSIGIYPGLGGTQRSALRVGKGLAKYLVLTGQMLNAKKALEMGLVDAIIQPSEIFEITSGEKAVPEKKQVVLSESWQALDSLYSKNDYKSIISGDYQNGGMDSESVAKLGKAMSFKAPIAMQFSQELIDAAQGPSSELDKLEAIFKTKDALLGLTSIGQRVKYSGE